MYTINTNHNIISKFKKDRYLRIQSVSSKYCTLCTYIKTNVHILKIGAVKSVVKFKV